jgi:hypothetical protein
VRRGLRAGKRGSSLGDVTLDLRSELAHTRETLLVPQAPDQVHAENGAVEILVELEEVRFDAEPGADGGPDADVGDAPRERSRPFGAEPIDEAGVDAVRR